MCPENVVILALSAGILFKVERLEWPLVYLLQHLSVYLPQLIQPHLRNIVVPHLNLQDRDHYNTVF
jgi:hypothetical protein